MHTLARQSLRRIHRSFQVSVLERKSCKGTYGPINAPKLRTHAQPRSVIVAGASVLLRTDGADGIGSQSTHQEGAVENGGSLRAEETPEAAKERAPSAHLRPSRGTIFHRHLSPQPPMGGEGRGRVHAQTKPAARVSGKKVKRRRCADDGSKDAGAKAHDQCTRSLVQTDGSPCTWTP